MQEWHTRVHLFEGDAHQQIQTYTEGVKTVDPNQAVGKPHTLWCAFAHFYERHGDIDNARAVFDKATQVRPPCPPAPQALHTVSAQNIAPLSNICLVWRAPLLGM